MRHGAGTRKLVIRILIIMSLVTALYLVVDYGFHSTIADIYSSLGSRGTTNINRSLQFVQTYTYMTKDTSLAQAIGLSQEEAQEMADNPPASLVPTTEEATQIQTSEIAALQTNDYMEIAKAIAGGYYYSSWHTTSSGEQVTLEPHYCYFQGNRSVLGSFTNHEDPDGNMYSDSEYVCSTAVEINGRSVKAIRRDCSAFAWAMAYAVGDINTNTATTSGKTHDGYSGWRMFDSSTPASEICPGDILWRSGHLDYVVKVDDDNIYIAGCGTISNIEKVASQGYSKILSRTGTLGSVYASNSEIYRKP